MPIDLNADVGEGLDAADDAILPLVTSANVACGGHAGDAGSMVRMVELALRHGVAVGAHPSYPDRESFGRRDLDLPLADLHASLLEQIGSLLAIARSRGALVGHVKPHGALYNRAAADRTVADVIAAVVRALDPELLLVGLAGSHLLEAGRAAGLTVAAEGFADRAYEADGSLRSRRLSGAVLETSALVAAQARSIAVDGRVGLDDGGWLTLAVDTLCLHGDSPGAVDNAAHVRTALLDAGVELRPLCAPSTRAMRRRPVTVVPFGERAYLLDLGGGVDARTNDRVHQLVAAIERDRSTLGVEGHPVAGYSSLLVAFDPEVADASAVRARLAELGARAAATTEGGAEPIVHRIVVRYGGADGPDLEAVAERTGLTPEAVIETHSAVEYRVFMLGFSPGFGYLGPLPAALRLPRRDTPRLRVPAGSVAIAGAQTAVYPHGTAGGWHLLGRSDAPLWDPTSGRPSLLLPGDRVRFEAV